MKIFELEERIMHAWSVENEIDVVIDAIDSGDYNEDTLLNMLIGIKELTNVRFNSLFNTYEKLLKEMWKNDESRTDRNETDKDGF